MQYLSDNELLAQSAADPEAFGHFYSRHITAMLGALRHRTGSTELAFDLAADVFAAALEGSDAFHTDHEAGARGWLYAIARNKLADFYRLGAVEDRARQRLGMQRIALSDRGMEELEARLDAGRSDVLAALELLPDHEREAVSARVVDEEDYPQIADRLNVSESVIRQRVSRGLKRLRHTVKEVT